MKYPQDIVFLNANDIPLEEMRTIHARIKERVSLNDIRGDIWVQRGDYVEVPFYDHNGQAVIRHISLKQDI